MLIVTRSTMYILIDLLFFRINPKILLMKSGDSKDSTSMKISFPQT